MSVQASARLRNRLSRRPDDLESCHHAGGNRYPTEGSAEPVPEINRRLDPGVRRSDECKHQRARSTGNTGGFTLIETMVALMIAATAAALILTQLRGMIARVDQERQHELDALRVLNQSAWLTVGSPGDEALIPIDETSMQIRYRDIERPAVTVRNFSASNDDVPPIVLAYTPFQQYSISAGSYSISLIAPAIERPDAIKPSRATATTATATRNGGDKTAESANRSAAITPHQQ